MSGARVVGYGENNMIQMLAGLVNSLRNDDPVDSFVEDCRRVRSIYSCTRSRDWR